MHFSFWVQSIIYKYIDSLSKIYITAEAKRVLTEASATIETASLEDEYEEADDSAIKDTEDDFDGKDDDELQKMKAGK